MTVRGVPASGGAAKRKPATPRRRPGKVELAARRVLGEIDTDHAAADLLTELAARLARDVDESPEVRDRVLASKELRAVLDELDTAVVPPKMPAVPPAGASGGGDPDDDDVFDVGAGPTLVVDPPAS